MVITLAEVKTFLGLTDTTKDAQINALIPSIQDYIINFTRNDFTADVTLEDATTISFDSTARQILDSGSGLAIFKPGDVLVSGSDYNDGYYTITTTTATALTAATTDTITDESAGNEITISRVIFPRGLKPIAAAIIGQSLASIRAEVKKSESIGSYSVTFQDGDLAIKPYLNQLRQWTKIKFL